MVKRPGQSGRGSASGRPIMVLLDVLGQRWMLRVIWELNQQAPATFRDLQARCENVSPTLLNKRLKELRALNLAVASEGGYVLTEEGRSLSALLAPLDRWAGGWAEKLPSQEEAE